MLRAWCVSFNHICLHVQQSSGDLDFEFFYLVIGPGESPKLQAQ